MHFGMVFRTSAASQLVKLSEIKNRIALVLGSEGDLKEDWFAGCQEPSSPPLMQNVQWAP